MNRLRHASSPALIIPSNHYIYFSSFLATSTNSRFEKKPFSAPVVRKSSITDKEKISFFVNYSIPPRGDEVSCCSIKRDGIKSGENRFSSASSNRNKPVSDDVEFESKSLHPVKFDQNLLDVWFTQNLTFKIHSRLVYSINMNCFIQIIQVDCSKLLYE